MEEPSLGVYQAITHNGRESGCVFAGNEEPIEEAGEDNHMQGWEIQEEPSHKEMSSWDLSFPRLQLAQVMG